MGTLKWIKIKLDKYVYLTVRGPITRVGDFKGNIVGQEKKEGKKNDAHSAAVVLLLLV